VKQSKAIQKQQSELDKQEQIKLQKKSSNRFANAADYFD